MTVLGQVKVLAADECSCSFTDNPEFHDRLVAIESMGGIYAAAFIAQIIGDGETHTGGDSPLDDPDDFGRFVIEHNWQDPVGMAQLAADVDWVSNQAWQSPNRKEGRAEMLRLRRRVFSPDTPT
jgi:hypothetical protein